MPATRNFFQNGKMLFLTKVIAFSNRANTYNYIAFAHANFNRDSPKINIFRDIYLKLGSFIQGANTKLSFDQNFDLGIRSENIEF